MFINYWRLQYVSDGEVLAAIVQGPGRDLELDFEDFGITATRHLITPTKTSDLTNDSGFLTSHQDVSGKADKVVPSAAGNLAAFDAQGNLADSGVKPSDFAAKTDLPYRLVEPGAWEFSGSGYDPTKTYEVYESGDEDTGYSYDLVENGTYIATLTDYSIEQALSIEFNLGGSSSVIATRPSLPGHLCDRAVNKVELGSDVSSYTLTFPAVPENGGARDFFVRLIIQGSTPPTISFVEADGVTPVAFDADDDSWADIEPGVNILMFTDTAR